MELAGWIAAALVGFALGLVGGGGGILTVPILTYLFAVPASQATGYSLFVVGAASLVGAWAAYRRQEVETKIALVFAGPSIVTVFATRMYLLPALPDPLIGSVAKDKALMLAFAVLMIVVAANMLKRESKADTPSAPPRYGLIAAIGLGVGLVSGFTGAGGGFLIVPALTLLAGLEIKRAIGTSLTVIALQSLLGFTGELHRAEDMRWSLLIGFTAVAVVGVLAGSALGQRISGAKLKPGLGVFVLVMGLFVLARETFF